MKKQLLIYVLFLSCIPFFNSCVEEDDLDIGTEVPVVVRFANGKESIRVDDETAFDIPIQLSKPVDFPVEVTFEVISNTLKENEDFKLLSSNSVVIAPGETQGLILFSSVDGIYDDGDKSFLIKLVDLKSDGNISNTPLSYPILQVIFNGCPSVALPSSKFTGSYKMILETNPGPVGPAFGSELDVNVQVGATSNERVVTVEYAPDLGIGQPAMDLNFVFASCGEINILAGQETNLACAGEAVLIGPSPNLGTYDISGVDDSEFVLTFYEFEEPRPACGVGNQFETTYRFIKN